MSFATSVRNRNSERALALLAAVAMLMSLMAIFAPSAKAHHPVIDSFSRCLDDGSLGIVVRSTSWTSDPSRAGNHDDVRLQIQLPGSSSWQEVGAGAYTPENGRRFDVRFSGSMEIVPGVTVESLEGQTIGARAQVMDTNGGAPGYGWYDDDGNYTTGNSGNTNADATMQVTLLDCEPPEPPPSGWACENGEVTFIEDGTEYEGPLYETEEEAANDPNCQPPEPPPSGWACEDGEVTFIEDTTDYQGTLYETEEEAANDPNCSAASAATTFSISGSCEVVEEVAVYSVSGDLGAGLTLQIDDQTVSTAGPFSIDVGMAGVYEYSVTVADGYELAEGSPATAGTIQISGCTPLTPEVGPPLPPSGWVCVDGEVEFIEDATDIDPEDLYETEEEAENDPACSEEVEALVLVTVSGVCELDGDDGVGRITVTMSVPGGATVVIRDSDGNLEGTLEDDGTITVAEGETYTWEATPGEGNEFPSDFDSTGSIVIDTCTTPDELPFTGLGDTWMALLATALLGAGAVVLRLEARGQES